MHFNFFYLSVGLITYVLYLMSEWVLHLEIQSGFLNAVSTCNLIGQPAFQETNLWFKSFFQIAQREIILPNSTYNFFLLIFPPKAAEVNVETDVEQNQSEEEVSVKIYVEVDVDALRKSIALMLKLLSKPMLNSMLTTWGRGLYWYWYQG